MPADQADRSHRLGEGRLGFPPPATSAGMNAVGLGVDLVHIPALTEQLNSPGTRFGESFAASERRAARRRAAETGLDEAHHLAARWAGKEAFIKAWSSVLVGRPPVVVPDKVDMAHIQIAGDAYGRPFVALTGDIAEAFAASVPGATALVSLSHDGDYAIAICQIVHLDGGHVASTS